MTAPPFNYFYAAKVELVDSAAGPARAYWLTNRPVAAAPDAHWPVLAAVGEVSLLAGEVLPQATVSAVELDDTPGSFGPGRKFSDVLARAEAVDRWLTLYVGTGPTDQDAPDSWQQLARVRVREWASTVRGGSATLTLTVEPFAARDRVLSLEVSRSVGGMQAAPPGSLGRPVPLLVGAGVDCLPVRISADGAAAAVYAWGTCLWGHLSNRSAGFRVYSKDFTDRWAEVRNLAEDTTALASFNYLDLNAADRKAHAVGDGGDAMAVGVRLAAKGNGLASSTAVLTVFVLRYEAATLNVVEEVARGQVYLALYDAQNAASTGLFDVDVSFDRPAFLTSPGGEYAYAVGWAVSGWQLGDLALHTATRVSGTLVSTFTQSAADSAAGTGNAQGNWKVGTGRPLKLQVLTTAYSAEDHVHAAVTETGLTYSKLTVTCPPPASGQSPPLLESVPLALGNLQGLSAYPDGAVLDRPHQLVAALGARWDPAVAGWVDEGEWDVTTLAASHYDPLYDGPFPAVSSRRVRGAFDQKMTFVQVLDEVCRGTASRVGLRSTGKMFLYPYGATADPVAHVPNADLTPLGWEVRDSSTVVNRIVVRSGRTFIQSQADFEAGSGGDPTAYGYEYANDFSAAACPVSRVPVLTAYSRLLFGPKEVLDNAFAVRCVNAAGSTNYLTATAAGEGSVVADYYLTRFGRPATYATFVVPFHRYAHVEQFDVVEFVSVAYPAYFGTDPDARPGVVALGPGTEVLVPADDGGGEPLRTVVYTDRVAAVPLANGGRERVRAQTYRGLVEGRTLVLPSDNAPAVRLTVLVLNNPLDPT